MLLKLRFIKRFRSVIVQIELNCLIIGVAEWQGLRQSRVEWQTARIPTLGKFRAAQQAKFLQGLGGSVSEAWGYGGCAPILNKSVWRGVGQNGGWHAKLGGGNI